MNTYGMINKTNHESLSESDYLRKVINENKDYWMLLEWLIRNEESKLLFACQRNKFCKFDSKRNNCKFDELLGKLEELTKTNEFTIKEMEAELLLPEVKQAQEAREEIIGLMGDFLVLLTVVAISVDILLFVL